MQLTYVNPETGADAENILGYYALMLRPGQTLQLPVRSPAMVFHLIEGGARRQIENERFTLAEADTCCSPGYTAVSLSNRIGDNRLSLHRRRIAAAPEARRIRAPRLNLTQRIDMTTTTYPSGPRPLSTRCQCAAWRSACRFTVCSSRAWR